MIKSLLGLASLACLTTENRAGTPTDVAKPAAPSAPWITGSASAGFDSSYYFRGLWFSNNNLWGSANATIPLTDKLTFGLGTLYTHSLDTDISGTGDLDYSELDLIASLNYDAGFAKFGLVATHYRFFDTFSGSVNGNTFGFPNVSDSTINNATDLGLTTTIPLGDANIYLGGWYDFKISGIYLEAGLDYTIKLTDKFSIIPSVQLGYGADYYTYQPVSGVSSGWTHVRTALNAPYKITDALIVTPYIAANFSLKARENLNTVEASDDVYGGISLSFSF